MGSEQSTESNNSLAPETNKQAKEDSDHLQEASLRSSEQKPVCAFNFENSDSQAHPLNQSISDSVIMARSPLSNKQELESSEMSKTSIIFNSSAFQVRKDLISITRLQLQSTIGGQIKSPYEYPSTEEQPAATEIIARATISKK